MRRAPKAIQLRGGLPEGWMEVRRPSENKRNQIAKLFPEMDEGESATTALALERREEKIIIDDAEARIAAEYFEL